MKPNELATFYVERIEKSEDVGNSNILPKKYLMSVVAKSHNSCPSPSKEGDNLSHMSQDCTQNLKRSKSENSSNSVEDLPVDGSSYVLLRKNSIQERRSVRKGSREGNLTLELNDQDEVKQRPKSYFPCRSAPPVELRQHRSELKHQNKEFTFDLSIFKSQKPEKENRQTPSPIRKRFTLHLPLKSRHHSQSPARRSPKSSSRTSLFSMPNTSPSSTGSPVKFLTPPSTPSSTFYITPPDSPKDSQTPSPTKKGKPKTVSPLVGSGTHSPRLRSCNSSGNPPIGFFSSRKER